MFCIQSGGVDRVSYDCTAVDALMVMSRTELVQHSPFYLDIVDAQAIALPILLVLSVAFLFRMIRKYLEDEGTES